MTGYLHERALVLVRAARAMLHESEPEPEKLTSEEFRSWAEDYCANPNPADRDEAVARDQPMDCASSMVARALDRAREILGARARPAFVRLVLRATARAIAADAACTASEHIGQSVDLKVQDYMTGLERRMAVVLHELEVPDGHDRSCERLETEDESCACTNRWRDADHAVA